MRHSILALAALALLAGCSGKSSSADAGGGIQLVDGVQLRLDRTRLLFGQDYGNAVLLGTQPVNTLQIISGGKSPLTISKVEIVAGTDADGGPLNDTGVFSASGPDKQTLNGGETALVQVVFSPDHDGPFGAILRITSNDPKSPTDVVLAGDCVTPKVTVLAGQTDITLPTVTLHPHTDGGTDYATAYETADVWFANSGTAPLQFKDAAVANDAGLDSPISVCTNTVQGGTVCQPGPLPNTLDRVYPDGGLAIRDLGDGGYAGAARMTVVFSPSAPGDYTGHVIVDSNATNSAELVFTVHGTANAP